MSFTGDLEHLPIVDVIQLLHSTRKSGTLTVEGNNRQSQLVFDQGYIVSANHSNLSVRIGQILVEMNAISQDARVKALSDQQAAGAERKPLVATLIESGQLTKEDAFRGLEILIEMTIVEILTWNNGTFTLDLDNNVISDEYRYFPEKCQQEINLNTQNILMDALRIYDEKVRDGELTAEIFSDEQSNARPHQAQPASTKRDQQDPDLEEVTEEAFVIDDEEPAVSTVSAADLGLDGLDDLEPKIPGVFASLKDRDEAENHRQIIHQYLPDLCEQDQERMVAFLKGYANPDNGTGTEHAPDVRRQAVVLFSQDPFTRHTATTACRHAGLMSFSSHDESDLEPIIDQSLTKNIIPVLVLDGPDDTPEGFSTKQLTALRQRVRLQYPQIPLVQMASPDRYLFLLQALKDGANAILPKPVPDPKSATFVEEMICFLDAFAHCVSSGKDQSAPLLTTIQSQLTGFQGLRDAPDVSFAILRVVRKLFKRALTMIVGQSELIVEKGLGFGNDQDDEEASLGFRIPLHEGSILHKVVSSGQFFLGECQDDTIGEHLYTQTGAPKSNNILLLPMKVRGRTVSITYGDFGAGAANTVPTNLLEILSNQAGLTLENALLKKQIDKIKT